MRTLMLSGRTFDVNTIDFTKTDPEPRLRGDVRLIAGRSYAVRTGKWGHWLEGVFVGKVRERTSCWNGAGGNCTYRSHLVFAVRYSAQGYTNVVETHGEWGPVLIPSTNIWGEWDAYYKSIEAAEKERLAKRREVIKHNEKIRVKLEAAALKLGIDAPKFNHTAYANGDYKIDGGTIMLHLTVDQVIAMAGRVRKK